MALGSAGAFISGFTEAASPFLQNIVQDQRKKKRQQERSRFITENLRVLDPNITAEEATARANLQVAGFPAPAQQPERPDLSELTTEFGLPDSFNKAWQAGALGDDPIKAINLFTKAAGKQTGPPTRKEFDLVKAAGGYENIPDYETLVAVQEVSDFVGGTVGKIFPDTPSGKLTKQQELQKFTDDKLKGKTIGEILGDPDLVRDAQAHGFTVEEIQAQFGFDPNALSKARKSIQDEIASSSLMFKVDFGTQLSQWLQGQIESPVLEKFYDRSTGELKEEALFDRVERDRELELRRLGMAEAKIVEIPPEIKQDVLNFMNDNVKKSELDELLKELKADGAITPEKEARYREIMEFLDG